MPNHRDRRALAVAGVAIALAMATTGCGRFGRTDAPEDAVGASAGATAPATPLPTDELAATRSPAPGTTPTAGPTGQSGSTPAPLTTPDLTAIQDLIDELDAALGADATADADEGSPK